MQELSGFKLELQGYIAVTAPYIQSSRYLVYFRSFHMKTVGSDRLSWQKTSPMIREPQPESNHHNGMTVVPTNHSDIPRTVPFFILSKPQGSTYLPSEFFIEKCGMREPFVQKLFNQ